MARPEGRVARPEGRVACPAARAGARRSAGGCGLGLLLMVAAGAPPSAGTESGPARALAGTDGVIAVLPASATVASYHNNGYVLTVLPDGQARIEVDLAPLDSRAPFELARSPSGPSGIEQLARSVAGTAGTRYLAVSRILSWVAASSHYDLDRSLDQSAPAVLQRRSGYCTGFARLTVGLLRAVGIEAREVAGYVLAAPDQHIAGFHRWVEVYYPDRGWVFSDPMSTHHFVPATYVRFAREELDLSRVRSGSVLERQRRLVVADLYPGTVADVLARRNRDRQRSAALRVAVVGAADGTALLLGPERRYRAVLAEGECSFVGLLSGDYQLMVRAADGRSVQAAVRLRPLERSDLQLALPSPRRAVVDTAAGY